MYSSLVHGQGVNPPKMWLEVVNARRTVLLLPAHVSWKAVDLNLC